MRRKMQGQDFAGRRSITHVNNCYQCVTWYVKIGRFLKKNLISILFLISHSKYIRILSLCVCLFVYMPRFSINRLTVAMCFMRQLFFFKKHFLWMCTKLMWNNRESVLLD